MSVMPEELNEKETVAEETITEETKAPESSPIDSKYHSLKEEFNQSLNGVVLKLEKKFEIQLKTILEELKPKEKEENKVTLETEDKKESNDSGGLTVQTLRSEYEQKTRELEEKFAASEAERLKDKKNSFISTVKSEVVKQFAKLGIDDIESASQVFHSMHSEDNFIQGESGTILYRTGEDQYSTLENLADAWKKGKIGKRFTKVNKPTGASLDEPSQQPKSSTTQSKKKLTLRQIEEGLQEGKIKVKY